MTSPEHEVAAASDAAYERVDEASASLRLVQARIHEAAGLMIASCGGSGDSETLEAIANFEASEAAIGTTSGLLSALAEALDRLRGDPDKFGETSAATTQAAGVPGERSPLVSAKSAYGTLNIPRNSFEHAVAPEAPQLILVSGSKSYPEAYIEALAQSPEWLQREGFMIDASKAFAGTDTAHQVSAEVIRQFEERIDAVLRASGNAALSNTTVAELLQVRREVIEDWKEHSFLRGQGLDDDPARGIPPHVLFDLYRWVKPASHRTAAETGSAEQVLLNREAVSNLLGVSVSGFQKVEQHIHKVDLVSGTRRYYPNEYIEALLDSGVLEGSDSPTNAARAFSHLPEAARAMAKAEQAMRSRIDTFTAADGTVAAGQALDTVFGLYGRTVRKWQADGILPILPKRHHSEPSRVTRAAILETFRWNYPVEYPQKRR